VGNLGLVYMGALKFIELSFRATKAKSLWELHEAELCVKIGSLFSITELVPELTLPA